MLLTCERKESGSTWLANVLVSLKTGVTGSSGN